MMPVPVPNGTFSLDDIRRLFTENMSKLATKENLAEIAAKIQTHDDNIGQLRMAVNSLADYQKNYDATFDSRVNRLLERRLANLPVASTLTASSLAAAGDHSSGREQAFWRS